MPIQFPANPTLNQTYTFNSITWTWNGNLWTKGSAAVSTGGSGATVTVSNTAPTSPTSGALWIDSELGDLNAYFSNAWVIVGGGGRDLSPSPTISNIAGLIVNQTASNITLYGSNFGTLQGTLRFNFGTIVSDVYVLPTAPTSMTAAVPAAIWSRLTSVTTGNLVWYRPDGQSSNALVATTLPPLALSYLVIGGGGGGGGQVGGGGGAGGFRTNFGNVSGAQSIVESVVYLDPTATYVLSVGAGGSGSTTGAAAASNNRGFNGSNSSITGTGISITSLGGGGGGSYGGGSTTPSPGIAGGAGGGGGADDGGGRPGGAGTAGQGFLGGSGVSSAWAGGGGGGAGAAGSNGGSNVGGAGGLGLYSVISGANVAYAGGGSGCSSSGAAQTGSPGFGGGAGGVTPSTPPTAGTANTGGGGGGNRDSSSTWGSSNGAPGGSGIIILRVPNPYTVSFGLGLTATANTTAAPGFTIYSVTAGAGSITFSGF